MNKEFRIWIDAIEHGKFIYPESITFYKNGSTETPEYRGGIVQQYTGLTDSTGKKIFEGDIVCTKFLDEETTAEVSYSGEYAAFLLGENAMWQGGERWK